MFIYSLLTFGRYLMKLKAAVFGLFILLIAQVAFALQERHLIIMRAAESIPQVYHSNPNHPKYKPLHLTDEDQQKAKLSAEMLLTYGFDNRNITAVYISPLPRAVETATHLAQIGVFSREKIHIDPRLIEIQAGNREGLIQSKYTQDPWYVGCQEAKSYRGESNEQVRKRVLAVYDDIEKQHPDGHVLFITHGVPAMELIDSLAKVKVRLQTAQVYLIPLGKRTSFNDNTVNTQSLHLRNSNG